MNGFSFSATANSSQSTSKPRLAGNNIYAVNFDGAEMLEFKDGEFKVIKLKFSNEDGTFEHTIFEPKSSDFERNTSGQFPQASNWESVSLLLKHAIDSLNPTVGKQIDSGTKNLGAADWNGFRKLVLDILNVGKGTSTKIKLIKNNKGEAQFPGFFAGLTKPDPQTGVSKAYIRNNFIGEKLAFTPYEIDRINNSTNADPKKVDSPISLDTPSFEQPQQGAGLDMNFDLPF